MAVTTDALGDYAGWDEDEARIWHSYMFAAVRLAHESAGLPVPRGLICRRQGNRLTTKQEDALALICFCAFALEYRMKRILLDDAKKKRKSGRERKALSGMFLGDFLGINRHRGKRDFWQLLGERQPTNWPQELTEVCNIRNKVAHGKWSQLASLLREERTTLPAIARRLYDAMILAMAMMNAVKSYGGTTNFRAQACMRLRIRQSE